MPVGQLVFGPLSDAFGRANVLVVAGPASSLVSLVTLASRSVRTMDRAVRTEP